ncbi:MAG: hypothetical protein NC131_17395 [Roseburia sp.]|nr:hypothetical protein [Roseburia sp.]
MRKLALLFFMTLFSIVAYAQAPIEAFCRNIDGYWGDWFPGSHYNVKGNYGNMVVYENGLHPSEYSIKITLDGYADVDKKERKRRLKAKEFYNYNGTVELYLSNRVPSVEHWLKQCGVYSMPNKENSSKKIVRQAKIKVAPYKDKPQTYFVYFDNGGFAISIEQ